MTTEELLAMPENGIERWLVRGMLREGAMTIRNRARSRAMIRIGKFLDNWLDTRPEPRGEVVGGEAGVRLRRNPDTTVGVDVAYVGPEVATRQGENTTLIDGVPVLVVEIRSPSDTDAEVNEKLDTYLEAGVAVIWEVSPHRRTVLVHRPGREPELFTLSQELTGDPELPGFRVPVAQIFA
jgi:Uma2 family endonuclease